VQKEEATAGFTAGYAVVFFGREACCGRVGDGVEPIGFGAEGRQMGIGY